MTYYIPILFTVGPAGQHYQRVVDGVVDVIVDAQGQPIVIEDAVEYAVSGEPVDSL